MTYFAFKYILVTKKYKIGEGLYESKKETTIIVEDFNVVLDKNTITSNGVDAVCAISFAAELEGVDSIQIVYTLNEFNEKTTTQRSNVLHLTDVTTDTVIFMEG